MPINSIRKNDLTQYHPAVPKPKGHPARAVLPAQIPAPAIFVPPIVVPIVPTTSIYSQIYRKVQMISLPTLTLLTLGLALCLRFEESRQEQTRIYSFYFYDECNAAVLRSHGERFGQVIGYISPIGLSWHMIRHYTAHIGLYSILRIGSFGADYVRNKCAPGGLPHRICTGIKDGLSLVSLLFTAAGILYTSTVAKGIWKGVHSAPFPESYCFIDRTLRALTPWMQ